MNKNELIAKCIENRILKEKLFKSGIIIHKAGNGEWDIDIRLFRTCESGRLITTIGEKLRVRIFEMSSSTPIPNAMVTKIIDDFETDGACETFGTLNVGCIVSFRKKAFKFEDIDESIIDELISNLLIEISDEQLLKASGNKDYGKDINKRIAAAGGSYHAITTYWKMHWKNEVSPEEFMGLVNSADPAKYRILLRAKTNWILDKFDAPRAGVSFPRREALIHAIAYVRGIKPADDEEFFEAIGIDRNKNFHKKHKHGSFGNL